jgi:predicted DNA-binding transcriptional regulator AlpA
MIARFHQQMVSAHSDDAQNDPKSAPMRLRDSTLKDRDALDGRDSVILAGKLALLLRHLAAECERMAGSSKASLAILRRGSAECRERAMARADTTMTVAQVAEVLHLNPRTIRRHEQLGLLPRAKRVGRSLRWRRNDIDDFVAENGR